MSDKQTRFEEADALYDNKQYDKAVPYAEGYARVRDAHGG